MLSIVGKVDGICMQCKLAFHPNTSNADSERGLERSEPTSSTVKNIFNQRVTLFWGVAGRCGFIYWM